MYSTVKEIHIALDNKVQQVNSDRKQTFYPEEYDIAINEAINQYVESKFSPLRNRINDGKEDNKYRMDEFKMLRREFSAIPYYEPEHKRVFTYLPANYKMIVSSDSETYYERGLTVPVNVVSEVGLSFPLGGISKNSNITITTNDSISGRVDTVTFDFSVYLDHVNSVDTRYVFINNIIDYLHRHNINAYYENFDRIYRHECLIVSNYQNNPTSVTINGLTGATIILGDYNKINNNKPLNRVENDLMSSEDIRGTLTNTYGRANRHNNPICEIINDRLNVYIDDYFYVGKVHVIYYKKPNRLDSYNNLMPDIPVTDDIVNLAATIILGNIKDNFGVQFENSLTNKN